MQPFVYTGHPARVVFGEGKVETLPDEVARQKNLLNHPAAIAQNSLFCLHHFCHLQEDHILVRKVGTIMLLQLIHLTQVTFTLVVLK